MPRGRPTTYKPEFIAQAKKLAKLGATDIEIADFFGVRESTLNTWKHTHPEFLESLKLGKKESDDRVERSLFRRAVGYEHDAVKIFLNRDGKPVIVPFRELVPPDTTACIFWLKNRDQKNWRDKIAVGGDSDSPLVIKVDL